MIANTLKGTNSLLVCIMHHVNVHALYMLVKYIQRECVCAHAWSCWKFSEILLLWAKEERGQTPVYWAATQGMGQISPAINNPKLAHTQTFTQLLSLTHPACTGCQVNMTVASVTVSLQLNGWHLAMHTHTSTYGYSTVGVLGQQGLRGWRVKIIVRRFWWWNLTRSPPLPY